MLSVKAWIAGKLAASTALQTALGGAGRIDYFFPKDAADLPRVTYSETNQPSVEFYDNKALAVESSIEIHVWTQANVSTSTISAIIDGIMAGLLFCTDFSGDYQEPETRINHRVLRYRRTLTALDLV